MQRTRILAISPHSDDVAFSLGAYLLGQCAVSHIQLVTVFSISKSTTDEIIKDSAVISEIRKAEDSRFVESLGQAMRVVWLDREDAPLRLHIPDEAVFNFEPPYIDLSEVWYVLNKVKVEYGSFDLLLAPMALGCHIDHVIVRNTALKLLEEGLPVVFYEDLPYAADFSLAEIDEHAEQLGSLAGKKLELFTIETGMTIGKKIALLSCYRSQMDSRTESRVRSHADRFSDNSVVERVWASANSLSAIQHTLKRDKP
jgi:LmbE family N-acetylglucosaminyl deacetylase